MSNNYISQYEQQVAFERRVEAADDDSEAFRVGYQLGELVLHDRFAQGFTNGDIRAAGRHFKSSLSVGFCLGVNVAEAAVDFIRSAEQISEREISHV